MSTAHVLAETPARESAAAILARFAAKASVDEATIKAAGPIILDTLAVTVAGGREPAVRHLAAALEPQAGGVPSLWSRDTYRADDAAHLFGMASHVLDYDDVSMLMVGHPSAPVLSALLAAAPRGTTSGWAFAEAFAIGTEVTIRLGQALGFRHYALGFHATATLGTIGSAAAMARLQGLDEAKTRHAIAIAASLASGLRANFGSMVKSLHVGLAAANGIKAARLAAAGIEGSSEPMEGEGFLCAYSGGEVSAWPAALVLGAPFALVHPGFEQKRYPCCYMLHKMIEGALALRRDTGLSLDDIASVRVDMPHGGTKPLIHPYPACGLNALFSAPYAILASLADGRIDLASFTDEAVVRPEIQSRLRDVSVVEADGPARQGAEVGAAPVTVTIRPKSGAAVARTITASPGSPQDPLDAPQLRAKWADCLRRAAPALADSDVDALFDEAATLAGAPRIDGFLERLRTAVA